jgi:hypothetical protein
MGQPHLTRFLPSSDGFQFTNSWPDEPAISIATPFGRVGIGNAARGLCGGMVFGALDFWHARRAPPASRPAGGEPLFRFIVRRLIQSWHMPAGVARYYYWMNLPDADAPLRLAGAAVLRRRGLAARTIAGQWPRIRAQLDAGQPAALGVVTVASANPLQLGHNHQVLAYAYQLDATEVTLQVYDPNSGPADDVSIRFDAAAPGAFPHSINIGWPVRGFFLTSYSPATPPGSVRPRR